MQRYEFNDAKSSKFWQVEQQGAELHISWGKIGTNGQSQIKSFDTEAKASAAQDKLVKEKTGKGYVAAGEAPMAAGATPKLPQVAKAVAVAVADEPVEPVLASTAATAPPLAVPVSVAVAAVSGSAAEPVPAALAAASLMAVDTATLEAALAARAACISSDEVALQAWPELLRAVAEGGYDNTSAKALSPSRLNKHLGLDALGWELIRSKLLDARIVSEWSYGTALYVASDAPELALALLP